jgi:hypothetical protein
LLKTFCVSRVRCRCPAGIPKVDPMNKKPASFRRYTGGNHGKPGWTIVIPTGICHCDSRRCLDSQPYFVIVNATGILIPTRMDGIPPVFCYVIPTGTLIPAGLCCCDSCRSPDSNRYGGNYGGVLLQLTSSTTCHALLIKIRNTFVLTSCQLMPKQQQDLPSVMASLDAPPMQL